MERQSKRETKIGIIKDMLECGMTYQQVADKMEFKSKSTIFHYINGAGVKYHVHRLIWTGKSPYYECKCGKRFKEQK